ncbi:hypothetical protein PsorP6_008124 [Peronosclerospora sorghi]|uniref:Uncharacterized protein n=1 Tax=Peronosclerospora sorghi TaxID=230839 RepID=A0ACC0W9A2_9STRA|nr:hypothetical protein PsorP6_008124 [Peronosclerospora sorghi]
MRPFRTLPLPEDETLQPRLLRVMRNYQIHFGHAPSGIARAPGRVNLIGEHVDYEGYAVLPMAIEQSVCVGFSNVHEDTNVPSGRPILHVRNTKSHYQDVALSIDGNTHEMMKTVDDAGAAWAKYVVCGVLGVRDTHPELFLNKDMTLQFLVDGDIPAGCGLASSSALVVASALATFGALQQSHQALPSRMEVAELCRQAELYVGTMGGGMDQAVACLAERGVAIHLDFATVPLQSTPLRLPIAGASIVVANCLVVAEKAVDAATRFNKRVVECALAAKLIAKKAGIDNWKYMTRLVEVQTVLSRTKERVNFVDLKGRARDCCPLAEYSIVELESEFGEKIQDLFIGSSLEAATKGDTFSSKILHSSYLETHLKNLGKLMTASHYSCRVLYECSCPELDALVDAAITAGALGARLTGAGWGGCIVALLPKADVSTFMKKIQSIYYNKQGIISAQASKIMFEATPSPGADLFEVEKSNP